MEPVLQFVNEPVYIRDINVDKMTDDFQDFDIEPTEYNVLSIDVGIIHLGLTVSLLDDEFNFVKVKWVTLINITEFIHNRVSSDKCKLYHSKTFCDWLNHVFQEHIDIFEMVDYILIERQPPTGFVGIEQLIFSKFRDKSILISPRSMHKFFEIGFLNYEQRKEYVERIALEKITDKKMIKQLSGYDRAHDICDSICMVLFWIDKKQKDYKIKKRKDLFDKMYVSKEVSDYPITINNWFEKHKYISP